MRYRALGGAESPGQDTLAFYGGGFGYRIANRLQFSLMAEYTDRGSTRSAERGFENNRIFATLNWGALSR